MKKLSLTVISFISATAPSVVFAQGMLPTMAELFRKISGLINQIIGLLFVVATAAFAWGIIKYFSAAGDEKKVAEARNYLLYGIITLAVMASAWGLAFTLIRSFSL